MPYALIDATSMVVNLLEWDGVSAFPLPDGCSLQPWAAPADIGATWDGRAYRPSPAPAAPPLPLPTGAALVGALTDDQAARIKTYLTGGSVTLATQTWWSSRYDQGVPADSPKFVRIAQKAGIDPVAWFAVAQGA